jgi:MFS family permease
MPGYGAILSSPGAARLLASALFARLPLGMASLAVLLLVRESTASFAAAGLVVGAYALGSAATAPLQGALIDRLGQARVLVPSAVLQASLLVGLTAAARAHAPVIVLVVFAALAGAAVPPLSASARALWPLVLRDPAHLESFYALDAVTQETIWIFGPLIVSACAALSAPSLAVLLCAAFSVSGTIVFCTAPASRAWRSDGHARRRGGALASGSLRILLCSIALTGCAWGCLTVGVPALALQLGSPRDAGVLLTLTSIGSLVGGLSYGRRVWSVPLEFRYAMLLAVISLSALPLTLVTDLRLAAPFAIVLGLGWAPAMSCQYTLVGRAAPAGSVTEAFTWQTSAFVGGASAGAAIAGVLAESAGAGSAFALLAGCALTASGIAAAVRRRISVAA